MAEVTVYASAARTATPTAVQLTPRTYNHGVKALVVIFDVTAVTSTPSTTLKIEGVDVLSGKKWLLLTGAAVASISTSSYTVALGGTTTANVSASAQIPESILITCTHGNANSMTYTVSAHFI